MSFNLAFPKALWWKLIQGVSQGAPPKIYSTCGITAGISLKVPSVIIPLI